MKKVRIKQALKKSEWYYKTCRLTRPFKRAGLAFVRGLAREPALCFGHEPAQKNSRNQAWTMWNHQGLLVKGSRKGNGQLLIAKLLPVFPSISGECWWWHGLVHKQSKVMLCAELHERTPLLLKKHSMLPLQNIYKPANDLALATPEKLWTRLSISLCFCKPPDCNTTCMCTYARTCVTWSKVHAHSCWFQTYCCLASFA